MSPTLRVQLVTPKGTAVDGQTASLTVSSDLGEMCILPDHCALLAAIVPCRLTVDLEGDARREYLVDFGFLEGGGKHFRVVTERCVAVDKLDEASLKVRADELEKQVDSISDDSAEKSRLAQDLVYHRAALHILDPRR